MTGAEKEAKQQMLDDVVAVCAPLGPVAGKAMFGGFGVFCDGLMFGLITREGDFYLKADAENLPDFERAGREKYGKMPYYQTPEGALDSWAKLEPWARGAVDAARRAAKRKRPRKMI